MNLVQTDNGLQVRSHSAFPVSDREIGPDAPGWARVLMAKVEEALAPRPPVELRMLSTDEAAGYVGLRTRGAFRDWAKRWGVRANGHNQWAVARLNAGLSKQRMQGGRARTRRSAS